MSIQYDGSGAHYMTQPQGSLMDVKVPQDIPDRYSEAVDIPPCPNNESILLGQTSALTLNPTPHSPHPGITAKDDGEDFGLVQTPISIEPGTGPIANERPRWKDALEEARYFAGGLINHPFESTKHYSILRHSHGLVYYQGLSTSIAITIFSDRPLPPDRKLWLQMKGWTGKTGMKMKTILKSTGSWIDVTPAIKAEASQLPASDERAWQRDIKKFLEKAPKELRQHAVRETEVVRIPCDAGDGYFRVVLTGAHDKVVLCPSPVFRLASTSTSASSLKGASLSTLPIELGVKLLSSTAKTAAGNAVAPITTAVQSQISQYQPDFWTTEAGKVAYGVSGVQERVGSANQQYDKARDMSMVPVAFGPYDQYDRPDIVGDPSGPQPPYPVRLDSNVARGTGRSSKELGMPTANLSLPPDDLRVRLSGTYFGWASISSKAKEDISGGWKQAIISIAPCPWSPTTVAPRDVIKAYLIHHFRGQQFFAANISLIVMGFLRPRIPYDRDSFLYETYKDIAVAQASLGRPAWGAEAALEQIAAARSGRSVTERYVDLRRQGQKAFDKVPLHKAGIRTPSASLKDRALGDGGIFVPR
ncbi:hypothetical protein MMC08_006070 [Hypocenomyce scalaris]|nr:hypothetical protein [Hypocenomyce scalaris]